MNRRGFTLAELLVALTLTAMLALLTARLLASAALLLRDRSERMALEHGLRVAAGTLRATFEPMGTDTASGSDLLTASPALLLGRAARASGVVCALGPGLFVVRNGASWWRALRDPVAGRDSVLAADWQSRTWRRFSLAAPPGAGSCPDGSSAITLSVAGDSAGFAAIQPGSPLLIFEDVELKSYTSAPDQWLGLRLLGTGQPVQPFAGPLGSAGLELTYEDRNGAVTADPALVAGVGFRVRAVSERAGGLGLVRGPPPRPDSVSGYVFRMSPP
jgi:prepilin-type N-terminal cleavage/methylation domain-containing protein